MSMQGKTDDQGGGEDMYGGFRRMDAQWLYLTQISERTPGAQRQTYVDVDLEPYMDFSPRDSEWWRQREIPMEFLSREQILVDRYEDLEIRDARLSEELGEVEPQVEPDTDGDDDTGDDEDDYDLMTALANERAASQRDDDYPEPDYDDADDDDFEAGLDADDEDDDDLDDSDDEDEAAIDAEDAACLGDHEQTAAMADDDTDDDFEDDGVGIDVGAIEPSELDLEFEVDVLVASVSDTHDVDIDDIDDRDDLDDI